MKTSSQVFKDRETFPEYPDLILSIENICQAIANSYFNIENILKERNIDPSYLDYDNVEFSTRKLEEYSFQEFLESQFTGIFRVNKYYMTPTSLTWAVGFGSVNLVFDADYLSSLLKENYDYYKHHITLSKPYYKDKNKGMMCVNLNYCLTDKKFF